MPYPVRATGQNPYGPQVEFRTEEVLPPTALYLSMDDSLVAVVLSSAVNPAFTLAVRMLLADGTIQSEVYDSVQNPSSQTQAILVIPPVEGYLLSCVAQLDAVVDGSCWIWIRSFKGVVSLPVTALPPSSGMLIAQGELDRQTFVAWPNTPANEAGTGAGRMRNISLATLAGLNFKFQTGPQQRWEIVTVSTLLITSAAAAARQMNLVVYDRLGNPIVRIPAGFTQAGGLSYAYYLYTSATHLQTNATWITAPLPTSLYLDPGMSLQSGVLNLDAGDQWGPINALVREWMGVGHA